MDDRATGLDRQVTTPGGAGRDAGSPREKVRQREAEVTALHDALGELVTELDRRRREVLDVKLQVRRHAGEVVLTGVALLGAAAGLVWFNVWRARRRARHGARLERLPSSVGRMIDRPERVAAEPTVPRRILGAAGSAAAAMLIKRVLGPVVQHVVARVQPAIGVASDPAQPPGRQKSPPAA
ncbi:MAG: hypothetical protein ACREK6_13135 [Candidatus Rokuibacteriota bacterium]